MKKLLSLTLALAITFVALTGFTNGSEQSEVNDYTKSPVISVGNDSSESPAVSDSDIQLGSVQIYDFGNIKVHAYKANDGLSDETVILETDDSLVVIDPPSFKAQLSELLDYLNGLGKDTTDLILAYHVFGTNLFGDATIYTSEAQVGSSAESGMGAGFVERFGDSFATGVAKEDVVLVEGKISISGIDLVIYPTDDGCDIAIPSINVIFMHMNGSSTHSIISSLNYIDSTIEKLQLYVDAGYDYVFTSHDLAESSDALVDKIKYLNKTKEIAQNSDSAEAFIAAMNEAFPNYDGAGYLEMSAGALFSE